MNTEDLLALLDESGISHELSWHEPVFTMAESARLNLELKGVRCKNLFLQNRKKSRLMLVVTSCDKSVDLVRLGEELGVGRLSFCSDETLWSRLGVQSGALTIFALLNDAENKVELIIDEALVSEQQFLFHPLVNFATISISGKGITEFLGLLGRIAEYRVIPARPQCEETL